LKVVFSRIDQLSHEVASAGNPMILNLSQNYVLKGLGKEVKVDSVVEISTTEDGSRITKLHDKWNGELPSGPIRDVSTLFWTFDNLVTFV
jgi:hypothetical protein